MAKKAVAKTSSKSSKAKAILWLAADKLRHNTAAAEYKPLSSALGQLPSFGKGVEDAKITLGVQRLTVERFAPVKSRSSFPPLRLRRHDRVVAERRPIS